MRKKWIIYICIICIVSSLFASGCSGEGEDKTGDQTAADEAEQQAAKEGYDGYIQSVLNSVNGNATPVPSADQGANTVKVDKTAPADTFISSMENPDTSTAVTPDYDPFATATPTPEISPSPTEDPNATPTPTPTPYITPEEFEVGKCCIYINGESDSAYGTEIITAINKARTDLGYDPLITNKGLSTCADRRTREIAASFDHTRPNGLQFYSLAPEHFKAEMLIKNNQKADEAVDTMIKNDPISRNLIFTTKYQSIGASSFKCNGMKYTVVSFGL